MLVLTFVWGAQYGLGIRDPDGIIGWRFTFVVALVGGFWALDVIPRGIMAARSQKAPTWATLVATARERWPWGRFAFVIGSIVAFYVTYLCYRNIKSYLPLARPRMLDGELADFERSLFGTGPRDAAAPAARHRRLRPGALDGLPAVPDLRADLRRRHARVVEQPRRGPVVGQRRSASTG